MVKFNVLIEQDEEGYYVSEVVELPGCHTQAKNVDELVKRTKEAIVLYLKSVVDMKIKEKFIEVKQIEV